MGIMIQVNMVLISLTSMGVLRTCIIIHIGYTVYIVLCLH